MIFWHILCIFWILCQSRACDPTDIIKIANENENENVNDNEHDTKMIMKVDNGIYNDDGNSENSDNSDDNNDNDRDNADYINDGSRWNNIGAYSQYEYTNEKIYQIENKDKHQEGTIVGHNISMYNDVYNCNINNEMCSKKCIFYYQSQKMQLQDVYNEFYQDGNANSKIRSTRRLKIIKSKRRKFNIDLLFTSTYLSNSRNNNNTNNMYNNKSDTKNTL